MQWVFWSLDLIESEIRKFWPLARRYPIVAIPALVALVIVIPLLGDAYNAIPWNLKKTFGLAVFAGILLLALRRIWLIKSSDDLPPENLEAGSWLAPWVAPLMLVMLGFPFLAHPENLGAGDWDLFLSRFESIRRSIVDYGQFPWWDPWCRGGFPLAASPHCGVIGVGTPLVLLFGTSVGLRLAALVCIGIATEGARRLARLWVGDPWASVVAGLVYGMNGAVLLQTVAGYHLPMSYCAFPWLLLCMFRLERSVWYGVGLGFWLAFNLTNGINYFSVYSVMILVVVGLRVLRVRSGEKRVRLILHGLLALGVMLLLSGWRLATAVAVSRDFPRPYTSGWAETPWSILIHLLNRPSAELARSDQVYFWETTCYIGPVVLVLAVISLFRGWRWWHTLMLICGLLASGTVAWHHPSYWLSKLPLFSSMHVATRWRIMAMLGVGLAAADVLARWRKSDSRVWRSLAIVAVAAVAGDYLMLGYRVLPEAFRIAPEESRFPGPRAAEIVQVSRYAGFPAVLRGYGVINAQEPLLGYDQNAPTHRVWRGLPSYKGEAWTNEGPVAAESWSPNRITFRVAPRQIVTINQNPGSWWSVNGVQPFPKMRAVETEQDFQAHADESGRVVLEVHPKGLRLGWILHAIGAGIVVLAITMGRKRGQGPPRSDGLRNKLP